MKRILLCLPLLYCVTGQSAELSALQQCRQITDSAARLTCYDAITSGAAANPEVATTKEVAAAPAAVIPVANTPAKSISAEAAPTASASTTSIASAVKEAELRQQSTQEFGLEHQSATAKLEQIVSRVPGVFRGWEPKGKITLENGQVWQVTDGSRGSYQLDNPVVTVERGAFGTFLLRIEGVNRSPKVKRLK